MWRARTSRMIRTLQNLGYRVELFRNAGMRTFSTLSHRRVSPIPYTYPGVSLLHYVHREFRVPRCIADQSWDKGWEPFWIWAHNFDFPA